MPPSNAKSPGWAICRTWVCPFATIPPRTSRTELLIFLTPRIIRGDADNEFIKQVESERMHFVEQEAEAIQGPLFALPGHPGQPEWMGEEGYCPPESMEGVPGNMQGPMMPEEGTVIPAPSPAPAGPPMEDSEVPNPPQPGNIEQMSGNGKVPWWFPPEAFPPQRTSIRAASSESPPGRKNAPGISGEKNDCRVLS